MHCALSVAGPVTTQRYSAQVQPSMRLGALLTLLTLASLSAPLPQAGAQPLIVRGPGAGAEVTAGGVFSDLLRLAAYLGAPS